MIASPRRIQLPGELCTDSFEIPSEGIERHVARKSMLRGGTTVESMAPIPVLFV